MTAGSGTGMSGTHTALVAISRRFAAEGWLTVLNGNLTGVPSVPGMCYVSPKSSKAVATWLASVVFDLTVLSNIFQSESRWDQVRSSLLCVIMENQHVSGPSCYRIGNYIGRQWRHGLGTQLVFAHLSSWGLRAHFQNSVGKIVGNTADDMHEQNACARDACPFTLEKWVMHDASLFRNPVDVAAIDMAALRARRRNEHTMIFPACQERGGEVSAKVFAALRAEWGATGKFKLFYYDKSTGASSELEAIMNASSGGHREASSPDRHVTVSVLSKADLMTELQEAGFFVYGLISHTGSVHYDTFASAVAESLASGVIVLAPRIAALPALYEGLVVFVDPPGGMSKTMQSTTLLAQDDSGLGSAAMVARYADTIRAILANRSWSAELRTHGRAAIRSRFAAAKITIRFYHYLNQLVNASVTNASALQSQMREIHHRLRIRRKHRQQGRRQLARTPPYLPGEDAPTSCRAVSGSRTRRNIGSMAALQARKTLARAMAANSRRSSQAHS